MENQTAAPAKKEYLFATTIAGRQYYDADDAWEYLHVGCRLAMVYEPDNSEDNNAVSLWLEKDGHRYKLGYLPRQDNEFIATMIKAGWEEAFECVISRIDPSESYARQIGVTVRTVCRK